jgi:ribosomal protein S18 acetylase RimI-like enzyme
LQLLAGAVFLQLAAGQQRLSGPAAPKTWIDRRPAKKDAGAMRRVAPSVEVRPVHPAEDRAALALAAQAWPEEERAAQWQSLAAAAQQGKTSSVVLIAARSGSAALAAVVAQALPGRTAILWPPQFDGLQPPEQASLAPRLWTLLADELRQRGVHLAQALTSPSDAAASQRLREGGLRLAAALLYLTADAGEFPAAPVALPCHLVPYEAALHDRLIRLIDRTYVGTLDCPAVDTLRTTADVVASYQAVGHFEPRHWFIAQADGKDIGCLLLARHDGTQSVELVYLGLVPEVRGQGLGLLLTRHAQWLARNLGGSRMVLAVDAANWPAIRMYAAAGFRQWDTKDVWLLPLR